MKYTAHILMLLILTITLLPGKTHAYFMTDEVAFTADNKSAVFAVEFSFGHDDHTVHIPILALPNAIPESGRLSYEVLTDENEVAEGIATGIVLGNAPIMNGEYVVPEGVKATFTLLMFFTPESTAEETYHAHVSHLPFSFDGTHDLKLNPSELQYYVTSPLTLGKSIFVLPHSI